MGAATRPPQVADLPSGVGSRAGEPGTGASTVEQALALSVFGALCPRLPCESGLALDDLRPVRSAEGALGVAVGGEALGQPAPWGAVELLKANFAAPGSPLRRAGVTSLQSGGPGGGIVVWFALPAHDEALFGHEGPRARASGGLPALTLVQEEGGPEAAGGEQDGSTATGSGGGGGGFGGMGSEVEMEVGGRGKNSKGDWGKYQTSLGINTIAVCLIVLVFSCLRKRYPMIYSVRIPRHKHSFKNVDDWQKQKDQANQMGFFEWLRFCIFRLSFVEIRDDAGLDRALVITFLNLSMKILAATGIPLIVIFCPLHIIYGGDDVAEGHTLFMLGLNNVPDGHWLWYLHAFATWYVTGVTLLCVKRAANAFWHQRMRWLLALPRPRATCALIDRIPDTLRNEDKLAHYFNEVLGCDAVATDQVYFVREEGKEMDTLRTSWEKLQKLKYSDSPWWTPRHADTSDHKDHAELEKLEQEVAENRKQVKLSDTAFVHFKKRRHVVICHKIFSPDDYEKIEATIPPDPESIIWRELAGDPENKKFESRLGMLLLAGMYLVYVPFVLSVLYLVSWEALEKRFPDLEGQGWKDVKQAWNSVMVPMVLSFFLWLSPYLFTMIFYACFVMTDHPTVQHDLQKASFWFLVIVVVFLSALAGSFYGTLWKIVQAPLQLLTMMAEYLPSHTHFFRRYLHSQWTVCSLHLLRATQFLKFAHAQFVLRRDHKARKKDPDIENKAKEMSEPEDQGSSGLGARCANVSLNMLIAQLFCSISPMMLVESMICLAIFRVVYGYLFHFAESIKGDLGGDLFVTQLKHVVYGLIFYNALMMALISVRTGSSVVLMILPTFYAVWEFLTWFDREYRWEFVDMAMLEHLDQFDLADRDNTDEQARMEVFKMEYAAYSQPEFCTLDNALEKCGTASFALKGSRRFSERFVEASNFICDNMVLKATRDVDLWSSPTSWHREHKIRVGDEMIAIGDEEYVKCTTVKGKVYRMVPVRVRDGHAKGRSGAIEADYVEVKRLKLTDDDPLSLNVEEDDCDCLHGHLFHHGEGEKNQTTQSLGEKHSARPL